MAPGAAGVEGVSFARLALAVRNQQLGFWGSLEAHLVAAFLSPGRAGTAAAVAHSLRPGCCATASAALRFCDLNASGRRWGESVGRRGASDGSIDHVELRSDDLAYFATDMWRVRQGGGGAPRGARGM